MITARAGSGMATELGSMRITEQIDALTTFAVDPIQYLVTPRVIATTLIMPIMTMVFNIVGLLGAYLLFYLLRAHRSRAVHRAVHATGPTRRTTSSARTKALVFGADAVGGRLLPGLQRARRRQGGRSRHDARRGRRLGLDPGVRLLPDRRFSHLLAVQVVNQPPAPTSQPPAPGAVPAPARQSARAARRALADPRPRPEQDVRAAARPARHRSRHRARADQHHHRRLGAGEVGADEAPHGPAASPDAGRSGSTATTSCRSRDARDGQAAPEVRHGVPVRGAVRFDERRREHRLPAASSATNCRATRSWSACAICCGASTWPNVGGIEQKFPPELSGGQRKRVGLARALIDRPEILLYDEPTTGLDPVATKNVDEMIRRTADDFGVTSVVISHDMASTFRIGDRISMLDEGKIVVTGTAAGGAGQPAPGPARVRRDVRSGGTRGGRRRHEAQLGVGHRRRAGAARRRASATC